MNPNLIIGISLGVAVTAGFACVLAHRLAKRRHWTYIPRYIAGAFIVIVGFGFPLFVGMDFPDALTFLMAIILIYTGAGIGTFLAHDADPDPPGPSTVDRILSKLDKEIGK